MYNSKLFTLILICKQYSIPNDIILHINSYIVNHYAQTIINYWYDYVMIHSINPCFIINKLKKYINYDQHNMPYYYYDLYDKNIGITFNICHKYINFNISSIDWWCNHLSYAFKGIRVCQYYNDVFDFNYQSICNFYDKLYNF